MKWTNPTLRAHLGVHGFLPEAADTIESDGVFYTNFVRGDDELVLAEFSDNREPRVFQDGRPVDVTHIGYRNSQIQHDKCLD
jgi:hypothetical protein